MPHDKCIARQREGSGGGVSGRLPGDFDIRVLTDIDKLAGVRLEWDELAESQKSFFPFLCFDWFRIWLEFFQGRNDLLALMLYRNGQLVAIAPFLCGIERFRGVARTRKISLIGNVHSPVRNFIIRDGSMEIRKASIRKALDFFRRTWREWDVIELESLPEEDGTVTALEGAMREIGVRGRTYTCYSDWYSDGIDCSGEAYLDGLPKKIRYELRRRKRRLAEMGEVRIEIGTDVSNFDRHMELYYEVRAKSWKSAESDREFLVEARRMAAEKGWLRCGFLLLDDEPIAAQIRIVSNGIVYCMEALHDEAFNKFGPGHILRSELIRHFIDVEAVTEIDQGRGDNSYKKYWSPLGKVRERKGVTIFNDSWRGRLLGVLMTEMLPAMEKYPRLLSMKERLSKRLR